MTSTTSDRRLATAFVSLSETLTSDYDVVELLHQLVSECVDQLDIDGAGLLLKNRDGDLELVASTDDGTAFVEMMQLNAGDGPCLRCLQLGEEVSIADVAAVPPEWEGFQRAALEHGYLATHAIPLRVRSETIGSIGLFRSRVGDLSDRDATVARALANLGSIGILHERVAREGSVIAEQLQRALDSRVLVEQAKGVVAASLDVDVDEAFRLLRQHARHRNENLHAVSRAVVDRTLIPRPRLGGRLSHE